MDLLNDKHFLKTKSTTLDKWVKKHKISVEQEQQKAKKNFKSIKEDNKEFFKEHAIENYIERLAYIKEEKNNGLLFVLSKAYYPYGLGMIDEKGDLRFDGLFITGEKKDLVMILFNKKSLIYEHEPSRLKEVEEYKGYFSFLYGPHHHYNQEIINRRQKLLTKGLRKMTELMINLVSDHGEIIHDELKLDLKNTKETGPGFFFIPFK